MVRAEEFFAPKKSKQERLKELAVDAAKKNAENEGQRGDKKIEAEAENMDPIESEDGSEKDADDIPGFDLDRVVEQLAKETGVDMAMIDENRARSRRESLAGQEIDQLHPNSKDIKKEGDTAATANLSAEELRKQRRKEKKKQRDKEKRKKAWYVSRINSCVYVQGLPKDITRQELIDFFEKAGVIRVDPETGSLLLREAKKKLSFTRLRIKSL